MSCSIFCAIISAYIDSEASPAEERALLEHINTCPTCKAMLESHKTVKDMLCNCQRVRLSKLDIDVSSKVMGRINSMSKKNI